MLSHPSGRTGDVRDLKTYITGVSPWLFPSLFNMTSTVSSSASLSLFVPVENPRPLKSKKPKTVVFDAQVWLPGDVQPMIAAFRYYNSNNIVFVPKMILWVHARLSVPFI